MAVKHALSKALLGAAAAAAIAVTTLPFAAQAGEVYNRVHDQQSRINQGVGNGDLTWREYRNDESNLDRINAQRRADLRANGGTLTPAERSRLNRELNRDSEHIYYTKHNRADR